jgi:integrase
MGLGSYPATSLAEARDKAREAAKLKSRGVDPLAAKSEARLSAATRQTFAEASKAFLDYQRKAKAHTKFPLRTSRQWEASLRNHVLSRIGSRDVRDLKHQDIVAILAPLALVRESNKRKVRGGPTVAARLRSRIERILEFSALHGHRDVDAPNPARASLYKELLGGAPAVQHHSAAPLDQVPSIYQRLAQEDSTVANAIRFIITTATRLRESLDCRWSEIDVEKALWTIPPGRSKTATEYVIPLSSAALAIIKAQAERRSSETWVFPGRFNGPMASSTISPALKRLGIDNTSLHGFRSSWSDWCSEIGDVPRDVAEFQLGHRVGSAVEQAYRRMSAIDARRQAVEKYARWLSGETGQVIAFPSKAATA